MITPSQFYATQQNTHGYTDKQLDDFNAHIDPMLQAEIDDDPEDLDCRLAERAQEIIERELTVFDTWIAQDAWQRDD